MKSSIGADSTAVSNLQGMPVGSTRADLKAVAVAHRRALLSAASFLAFALSANMAARLGMPLLADALRLGCIVGSILVGVFTLLLGLKLRSPVGAVVFGVFAMIPCLGLLAFLAASGKATGVLRQNGIRVGMFGADPSSV